MPKLLQKNLIMNCKISFRLDQCCSGGRTFSSWSTAPSSSSSSSNMEKRHLNSNDFSTRNDHSYYCGKDRRSSLSKKEQLSSSTKSFQKIKRGFSTWRGRDFGRDRDNRFDRYRSHDSNPDRDQRSLCGYFGGDHLYGISSVRIALLSGKRVITELLVQEGLVFKKKDKGSIASEEILKSADSQNIKVRYMPLHDLNLVTENKDHQGYVLRAAPLDFKNIESLEKSNSFQCVLALDEVMDPQNFGALLRTSHFLGVQKVIICGKNSAPMTPTVSNVSFGALEIIDINFADNLAKFLERSQANGWQVGFLLIHNLGYI
jgi:tRNA G18 (ribose-2'-O)-methylase SpoU